MARVKNQSVTGYDDISTVSSIKKEEKKFNLLSEPIFFIKSVLKGISAIFDFFITIFTSLFSYVYYGINTILSLNKDNVSQGIDSAFKPFIDEISLFFKSILGGLFFLVLLIIYDIPFFILKNISNAINSIQKSFKSIGNKSSSYFKQLPKKLQIYLEDKIDNIEFVRKYKEKQEAKLSVLVIDKEADSIRSREKHTYQYLAKKPGGKLVKGYFNAFSKLDTYSYLVEEGFIVYEIKTSKWISFIHGENKYLAKKMKTKDLVFWLTQLSTYIKAGIPLTDAVKILAKQNKEKRYNSIFDSIIYELTMGESFSEALRKQGTMFPTLLINMLRASEMIGDIEGTLDEMAAYYEETEDTKRAFISALTYPSIIVVFALAVVTFILVWIIPQFVNVYKSMPQISIPASTQLVINISDFLKKNYIYMIVGVASVIIVVYLLYDNVKEFRKVLQVIAMKLPVFGNLIVYSEISMFSKTFASLNKNNVLLTDTIDILSKITNNEIYKKIMFVTINNLASGEKMSLAFKDNWAVPELAYYMIKTGESTGELANMLDKVADFYSKQLKASINTLKAFIEPVMIILLAVIVGGIIVAVIVPMFGLYQAVM